MLHQTDESCVLQYHHGFGSFLAVVMATDRATRRANSTGRAGQLLQLGEQIKSQTINQYSRDRGASLQVPPRGGVISYPALHSCLLPPSPATATKLGLLLGEDQEAGCYNTFLVARSWYWSVPRDLGK